MDLSSILEYASTLTAVVTVVVAVIAVFIGIVERFRQARSISAEMDGLKVEIKESDQERAQEVPFVKEVARQLERASQREKLTALKASGRSATLSTIATTLMVLSVFAPLGSLAAYTMIEPLPSETVDQLTRLAEIGMETPEIRVERDWRILVSGLSFGFLFLAAARSVMRQERQERATFAHYERSVTYLNNVASAALIRDAMMTEADLNDADRDWFTRIIEVLLTEPTVEGVSAEQNDSDHQQPAYSRQAREIVRSFTGS